MEEEEDEDQDGQVVDGEIVEDGAEAEVDGHESDGMDEEDEQEDNAVLQDDSSQGFFEHRESVYALDISPYTQGLVASGGGDDSLYLWDAATGASVTHFKHKDSVVAVRFSPRQDDLSAPVYLASGAMDGQVKVLRAQGTGWEMLAELQGPDEILWLDWHKRGSILLAGANDGTLWMWKIPQASVMGVFTGHLGPVTCGRFMPDGKRIISASEDGSLIVWHPQTGEKVWRTEPGDHRLGFREGGCTALAVNEAGSIAVLGGRNGRVRMINIAPDAAHPGQVVNALDGHTDSVECIAICQLPDLLIVATGAVDGKLLLWEGTTGRLRAECLHPDAVTSLAFCEGTTLLLSASVDGKIRVWDARNGELRRTFSGHQDGVLCLARQGPLLVSGSDDGTALVFQLD